MPTADTIVALSSPSGESAIALIRLTGPACAEMALAITQRSQPLKKRYAHFAKYIDVDGIQVDECIFTYYADKQSFTGESMLEIAPVSYTHLRAHET